MLEVGIASWCFVRPTLLRLKWLLLLLLLLSHALFFLFFKQIIILEILSWSVDEDHLSLHLTHFTRLGKFCYCTSIFIAPQQNNWIFLSFVSWWVELLAVFFGFSLRPAGYVLPYAIRLHVVKCQVCDFLGAGSRFTDVLWFFPVFYDTKWFFLSFGIRPALHNWNVSCLDWKEFRLWKWNSLLLE